ncbi:MAG: hypothetical protein ABSH56_20445, partial [Bryobacteraceae bacterium]
MKCTFAAIFAATLILVAGDVDAQTHLDTTDQDGEGRLTGGKGNDRGTPQGGVISPALANLYMNRMLKGWR